MLASNLPPGCLMIKRIRLRLSLRTRSFRFGWTRTLTRCASCGARLDLDTRNQEIPELPAQLAHQPDTLPVSKLDSQLEKRHENIIQCQESENDSD